MLFSIVLRQKQFSVTQHHLTYEINQLRHFNMSDQIVRHYRVLNNEFNIIDMYKYIHPVNRNMLFNRWVSPSVVLNDDVYIVDHYNYRDLYTLCLQKDIQKNNNTMSQYKTIQQMAIHSLDFHENGFVCNKAFNVIDFETQKIHEIRILYAYFISNKYTLENIRWRLFIDDLKMNLIVKTSLVKKLMKSTYTNNITQLSLQFNEHLGDTTYHTLSSSNTDQKERSNTHNKHSSKSSNI